MKTYTRPKVKVVLYIASDKITSLNQWLINNELTEAGITTYIINS